MTDSQALVLAIVLAPAVVGVAVSVRDTLRARRHPCRRPLTTHVSRRTR